MSESLEEAVRELERALSTGVTSFLDTPTVQLPTEQEAHGGGLGRSQTQEAPDACDARGASLFTVAIPNQTETDLETGLDLEAISPYADRLSPLGGALSQLGPSCEELLSADIQQQVTADEGIDSSLANSFVTARSTESSTDAAFTAFARERTHLAEYDITTSTEYGASNNVADHPAHLPTSRTLPLDPQARRPGSATAEPLRSTAQIFSGYDRHIGRLRGRALENELADLEADASERQHLERSELVGPSAPDSHLDILAIPRERHSRTAEQVPYAVQNMEAFRFNYDGIDGGESSDSDLDLNSRSISPLTISPEQPRQRPVSSRPRHQSTITRHSSTGTTTPSSRNSPISPSSPWFPIRASPELPRNPRHPDHLASLPRPLSPPPIYTPHLLYQEPSTLSLPLLTAQIRVLTTYLSEDPTPTQLTPISIALIYDSLSGPDAIRFCYFLRAWGYSTRVRVEPGNEYGFRGRIMLVLSTRDIPEDPWINWAYPLAGSRTQVPT
ncbi:hypothetical protein MMC16_002370 [Acarospora aff. strigata]|nr:hypothetical protein [Acarospora aff. strigata]